jgi:hypothetical protein
MKPENVTNWVTWVNRIAVFLVSLLAIGAFALSYNALYGVASSHGIPGGLAYVWPLLIDGAIVVFSISVVRASLLRERAWWPWALVIVFTAGTVFFNILHFVPINRPLLVSITIAIIAPVGLVLAFETVMGMLKSNVARREFVQSIAQIEAEMGKKTGELDRLQHDRLAEIEALTANRQSELANLEAKIAQLQEAVEVKAKTLETYQQDIGAKREELKGLDSGQTKIYVPANLSIEQRRELVNRLANEGLTNEAISLVLGCSVGTIKNDKSANRTIRPLEEVVTESGYTRNGNNGAAVGKVGSDE